MERKPNRHIVELTPNNAIYLDGYRIVGTKPYGLFTTKRIAILTNREIQDIIDYCNKIIRAEDE